MRLLYILTMLLHFNNNNPKYLYSTPLWHQHGFYLQIYIKIDHGRMYNFIEGKNYCCRQYFSTSENSKWKKNNKRMILTIFTIIIKEDIVCVHMQKKVSMFIKDCNHNIQNFGMCHFSQGFRHSSRHPFGQHLLSTHHVSWLEKGARDIKVKIRKLYKESCLLDAHSLAERWREKLDSRGKLWHWWQDATDGSTG